MARDELNEAQKEAVATTEGPLLVLAGAGAGKTKVIVERILEIIRRGTPPEQVLAVTFTNKAAGEMRERVRRALANEPRVPFVSTFHSLGLTLIKENYRRLELGGFPIIYDRTDSLRAMREALKGTGGEGLEPRGVLSLISREKGEGITAGEYAEHAENAHEWRIASAWLAYERALALERALDFDDLLLRAERLLKEDGDLRERYQRRWHYLHIDEYQDTNHVQARMAGHLVGKERNVCAVGDIDQTIYSWRGAKIQNILSFEKEYPGARVVTLEENYRSTKNILAAANDIIVKNVYRPEKNLYTKNEEGSLLSLFQAMDEGDEAWFMARTIGEKIREGARPKDFVVLYRANFQSRAFEEALLAAEIPYQVLGTRFFERKEVKDVLSFIRAALFDTASDLSRIANVPPRGIGKVTLLKLLAGKEGELDGALAERVKTLRTLLARIRTESACVTPSALIAFVLKESGLQQAFKKDKFEGAERLENIGELAALASRYDAEGAGGLEAFLESAALASEQDEFKEEADAVRLMTVHAAKGLEFPYVCIVGLEEGLFPYERDEPEDGEEERRLMYVALTRAQKKIYLSYASFRTVFGATSATLPSQFLTDISPSLLEWEGGERLGKTIYLQ